jgi:hypothetical protein
MWPIWAGGMVNGILGQRGVRRVSMRISRSSGCQHCGNFCCCLLQSGADVMILMASQSCASCEGLLAIRILALVGTFTRVDSSMASKGARVGKRLYYC